MATNETCRICQGRGCDECHYFGYFVRGERFEITPEGSEALQQAARARRVTEEEQRIIATEGVFYVAGQYYGALGAADRARRIEAERRVRQAERREALQVLPTADTSIRRAV